MYIILHFTITSNAIDILTIQNYIPRTCQNVILNCSYLSTPSLLFSYKWISEYKIFNF